MLGALVAIATALLGAAPANADHSGDSAIPERAAERAVGPSAETRADGLISFRARGERYTTHGPDVAASLDRGQGRIDARAPERAPRCGGNGSRRIVVLYAYPEAGSNRLGQVEEDLLKMVRQGNYVVNRDSIRSGGNPADFVYYCNSGVVKVDAIEVPSAADGSDGLSFERVIAAADAAGYDFDREDYGIFVDGPDPVLGACGFGTSRSDDSAGSDNRNNNPDGDAAGYAAFYNASGCWNPGLVLHELLHAQGAVQNSAPFATGKGHCYDAGAPEFRDVMCQNDGGSSYQSGFEDGCEGGVTGIDCHFDNYFDAAPESGEWLETHWNIGGPNNSFIVRSPGTDGTAPETTIASGPPDGSVVNTTIVEYGFASSESGSSFECALGGGQFGSCNLPAGHRVSSLREGTRYLLEVRATDPAGNTDDVPARTTFTYEAPPPETFIDEAPGDGSMITDTTPTLEFHSDVPDAYFFCVFDDGPEFFCKPRSQGGGDSYFGPGEHRIQIKAVKGGKEDPTPEIRRFTVVEPQGEPAAPAPPPAPGSDGGNGADDPGSGTGGGDNPADGGTPAVDDLIIDPAVDDLIIDLDVTAKKKQTQKGKRIKVKISVGAQEPISADVTGKIKVKGQKGKFALGDETNQIDAGERTVFRLTLDGSKNKVKKAAKKVSKGLKKYKEASRKKKKKLVVKAPVVVTATDSQGNEQVEKRVVTLK